MAAGSTGEKTEKPSAKKLRDARDKGQVPRSQDLVAALGLLAVTAAFAQTGAAAVMRVEQRLATGLSHLGDAARGSIDANDIVTLIVSDLGVLGLVVGPFLVTAAVVAVGATVAQSGWVFAPEKLTPDFSRLSPSHGIQRFKPSQSGFDVIKTLAAATVLGVIAFNVGYALFVDSPRLAWMAPGVAAVEGWHRLLGLMQQAGFALFALAGADYGMQRWRWYSGLKMTKQEVRDDARSADGNPEIKGRVRKIQREMARRRMLSAVKDATVIVTNPTHFAVALKYQRSTMTAPVVIAKGQDLLAQRIKEIGRDKGVPMVENVPLAQALYREADVGQAIPADLFGAVAEVLAYLVRIKQVML